MNSIYLLIPVTGVFLGIAIWAFIWAVNNDQFDDMDSAASSILFDDDEQATIDAAKTETLKTAKDCTTAIKNNQDNTGDC